MVSYMTTLSLAVNRCTDGSAGGVFRLRSLAKTRISYLFGEQALLFEQFPNGFQLVHIVDGHFAEIEKSLPVFGIRHIGSLWGR